MSTERLLEIIDRIAAGDYSDDIMPLTAPNQPDAVRRIAEAMGMMMVKVEAREFRLEMLIGELQDLNRRIKADATATVATMAHALEARDAYTQGHAARVGSLAQSLARELGLDDDEVELVRLGGVLHDIGKIGFRDVLFDEHGAKNPPEVVKIIMSHPVIGAEILRDLNFLGPALDYVRWHHERPDGKGYPDGLAGEAIPLGARIIAVCDAFDAMTTNRPYQKGMDLATVLGILRKQAGKKWDAAVVEAFAGLAESGRVRPAGGPDAPRAGA